MSWTVRSEAVPLGDLLVRSALRCPDTVALAIPGEHHTFSDLFERSVVVARSLVAFGVRAGDNVGVLAPNSFEYAAGLFGAALIGAVLVPINVRSTSSELRYIVSHAELSAVLTTDRIDDRANLRDRLAEALEGLADANASEPLELPGFPHLRRVVMLRGVEAKGCVGQTEFEAGAEKIPSNWIAERRARVRIRDTALILYTSGTTSNPKGCMISHEAITRGSLGRIGAAFPFGNDESVIMWCPAPMFHIAALQGFLFAIGTGSTFVTDVYLDADRALASILEWKATSLWGMFMPPLRTLLTAKGFRAEELGFVKSFMTVGPASELREWQSMFPQATLVNGAGMSETAGWFSMSAMDESDELRATTAGTPVAGAEVRIVDPETLEDQPPGVRGELLVKTYSMLTEYFHDPGRTDSAIDGEGWLHTGDLFSRLPSGHLVYDGRIKDMLKVGGENVPAIEVETFLCGHPSIRAAEIVGIPDPRLDEVPVAFVELARHVSLSDAEIIAYCRGQLSSFKIPRAVYFVAEGEWPMSASKVNKNILRAQAVHLTSVVST